MKTLVVGATGYVTNRAIPEFLAASYEVVAAARGLADVDAFW